MVNLFTCLPGRSWLIVVTNLKGKKKSPNKKGTPLQDSCPGEVIQGPEQSKTISLTKKGMIPMKSYL